MVASAQDTAAIQRTAAKLWDELAAKPQALRLRYWDSPALTKLVNRRYVEVTGCHHAMELITRCTNRTHFGTAVSIGCGTAWEELWMLQQSFVDRFVLCDFSSVQLDLARQNALQMGIDLARISFRTELDITKPLPEKVDLAYWRSSLHHMLDTDAAVAWSIKSLRGDGAMYCNDYCGPNRMQWPPEMLDWAERLRSALPPAYLRNPYNPAHQLPSRIVRDSVEHWVALDPTECADSENIIPALKKYAPTSNVFYLGGVIYHLALNDIIHNFDDERDEHLLELSMMVDRLLTERGLTHFFVSVSDVRDLPS